MLSIFFVKQGYTGASVRCNVVQPRGSDQSNLILSRTTVPVNYPEEGVYFCNTFCFAVTAGLTLLRVQ